MWDPMKEVRYDPAAIREKYGLTPEELVEVRALAGDASDNIPGVPGIGEKTALKLIAEYHSLENLLAHVDEIKEKSLRDRLKEHADQARLSRRLTVLECAVPLTVDLEALQPGPPGPGRPAAPVCGTGIQQIGQGVGVRHPAPRNLPAGQNPGGSGPGGRGNPGRRRAEPGLFNGGAAPGAWRPWPGWPWPGRPGRRLMFLLARS